MTCRWETGPNSAYQTAMLKSTAVLKSGAQPCLSTLALVEFKQRSSRRWCNVAIPHLWKSPARNQFHPFTFKTHFKVKRISFSNMFLDLLASELVQCTWITGSSFLLQKVLWKWKLHSSQRPLAWVPQPRPQKVLDQASWKGH